ncbi:hypothetical protein NOS3756_13230 [Nostoc sp. NIES-3756]|uniref:hypothetical protein n=1 Tax=Nostoc sp. NIES-3756 TaxID=1751286 RepID=UPI0007230ADB|nr:hypothetical protein [Nostoc sp. NIES-3756]BAT52388.1 hypothetical protein NOS3756_13230 [Nostoc sp. NIES-3756]
MYKLSKNSVSALTIFSLYCSNLAIFTNPVMAGEPILDRNCRHHARTPENFKKFPPQNRATIYFTSGFNAGKQKYFLQVLKFPNSTSVFCLINPKTKTNQKINKIQLIQDKKIEKIEKFPDKQATYIVRAEGDKNENVFRVIYKLNLSNPYEPKLSPLIKIYNKGYIKTSK